MNSSDPSGEWTPEASAVLLASVARDAEEAAAAQAIRDAAAARAAAEQKAAEEAAFNWRMANAAGQLEKAPQGASEGGSGGGCSGGMGCAAMNGKEWVCTISGNIVAAGVGVATAGLTGILAGFVFTEGCNLGAGNDPAYLSGLPRRPSDCFNVFTLSKRTHKYNHKFQECYA